MHSGLSVLNGTIDRLALIVLLRARSFLAWVIFSLANYNQEKLEPRLENQVKSRHPGFGFCFHFKNSSGARLSQYHSCARAN